MTYAHTHPCTYTRTHARTHAHRYALTHTYFPRHTIRRISYRCLGTISGAALSALLVTYAPTQPTHAHRYALTHTCSLDTQFGISYVQMPRHEHRGFCPASAYVAPARTRGGAPPHPKHQPHPPTTQSLPFPAPRTRAHTLLKTRSPFFHRCLGTISGAALSALLVLAFPATHTLNRVLLCSALVLVTFVGCYIQSLPRLQPFAYALVLFRVCSVVTLHARAGVW